MRKTSLYLPIILLLSTARPAAADEPPTLVEAHNLAKARRLKVAGIVLTSVALALEVATIGIWASGKWLDCGIDCAGTKAESDRAYRVGVAGISTAVSAALVMGIGIPLWSFGAHQERASRRGLVFTPSGLAGTF